MKKFDTNRSASHDFHLLETFRAGIQLLGSEVKAVMDGNVALKGGWVEIYNGEAFLHDAYIGVYALSAPGWTHEPKRKRKLLLNKKEITYLAEQVNRFGVSLIPITMEIDDKPRSKIKLTFAIGKGKKYHDKRESEKNRSIDKDLRRLKD